jgi:hypothetical protein
MRGDGVERNRDSDETGTSQEDHEHGVSDREQFSTPSTSEDVTDTVHTVDFWMVHLECTDNMTGPSGEQTDNQDDWRSALARNS